MTFLQPFADRIWIADGTTVHSMGMPFPTRMIIAQLADGSMWVNSPVSVAPEVLDRIMRMGPIKYLVAPTKLHVWRLESWHELFPEAELWAPPQVPDKFKRLPFIGMLGDQPPVSWANDFEQLVFRGNIFVEEIYFLHRRSRTLIVADFIQSRPLLKGRPFRNAFLKLAGVAPDGGVPIDIRLSFLHRTLARQSLARLLSWDFDKLILAHGDCVVKDAKAFVECAFRWLTK
jgi:hypothetical protein